MINYIYVEIISNKGVFTDGAWCVYCTYNHTKLATRMGDNEGNTSASASIVDVPTIPPFSVDDHNTLSQRWVKWKKSFAYYVDASGVKDDKQKRALLLHLAGPGVQEIFETLEDTGESYETALEKLTAYFEPRKNIPFERHVFRQEAQGPTESIDTFVTRLKKLAKTCDYGENEAEMIRDQVVDKCNSSY